MNAYTLQVNGIYKKFNNVYEWFKLFLEQEIKLDQSKYYIDTKYFGKALFVAIREVETNKLIKTIYKNLDIASDFVKAIDGLYYNKSWSKSGKKIEMDGLGWTVENIREYFLECEVINEINNYSHFELVKDDIRYCFV